MVRRSGRGDNLISQDEILATMSDLRWKVVGIQSRATIGGPLYRSCETVREAIDGVVEAVTGDRTALWEKGGASPSR